MADAPRPLRPGRFFSEAELAAAANAAFERAKNPDGSKMTQADLAGRLNVKQHTVSAALGYLDNPKNQRRGHDLRRRILRELAGLTVAGPYWLAQNPGEELPGFDPYTELPRAGVPRRKSGRKSPDG